jgi:hypothetical protein
MYETTMNIAKPAAPPLPPELIARFREVVGDKYAVTDAAEIAPYVTEERDLFHGRSPLVLRPGSTAEVSAICKLASEHRIALVPQGGNTGLVGGQTPHHGEVVISMRRIAVDATAPCDHDCVPPRVRDDREPPLWGRDGRLIELILASVKAEYFSKRGWT